MRIFVLSLFISFHFANVIAQGKLLIATYRYSENDRVKNIQPLANYLATTCGCETGVKSYESVSAMLEAMKRGEPDIVLMNTFGYLLLNEDRKYEPLTALKVAAGRKSTYQSIIIANKATGLRSLKELHLKATNLRLLLVNTGSTSGNLVPRLGLASIGITDADRSFKEINYSKNHSLTLRQVAEGKADVGAFGREEYDKIAKSEPLLLDNVTVLWTSKDIPLGPVVYNRRLDKKLKNCLEATLLSLHEKNSEALEAVKGGWTEAIPADRYIKIKDKDYQRWLKENGSKEIAISIIQKFTN